MKFANSLALLAICTLVAGTDAFCQTIPARPRSTDEKLTAEKVRKQREKLRQKEEAVEITRSGAFVYCTLFAEKYLKSPKSAEWPSYREIRKNIVTLSEIRFRIPAYVDAQNSFGALLRSKVVCQIQRDEEGDQWILEMLRIGDNMVVDSRPKPKPSVAAAPPKPKPAPAPKVSRVLVDPKALNPDTVKLLSKTSKILTRANAFWKMGWKISIQNTHSSPVKARLTINLVGAQGAKLGSIEHEDVIILNAGEISSVQGTNLFGADAARNAVGLTFEFYVSEK